MVLIQFIDKNTANASLKDNTIKEIQKNNMIIFFLKKT